MSTPPTWPPPPPPPPLPPGVPGGPPPSAQAYLPTPQPKSSAAAIVVILIVVVFGGIFVVGIIAAIAIPSLLRARTSGNETAALGALRTMESAQVAWASRHGGHFVHPDCLAEPPACGDAESPSLLPIDVALLHPHSGYDFGFILRPGADAAATDDGTTDHTAAATAEAPGVSPPGAPSDAEVRAQLEQISTPDTGATTAPAPAPTPAAAPDRWPPTPPDRGGFVYWASPSKPGVTGRHRFCIDETGLVRAYATDAEWTAPTAARPRCPDVSRSLQ